MLCKISDLLTEIPTEGGMSPLCKGYLAEEKGNADIVIKSELYNLHKWSSLTKDQAIYMESGFQFYGNLLKFDGMMLHASAVALDGKAYLFSGPSGMGKSTHTRLWQQLFGDAAKVFNDDKPAIRRLEIDGTWYAYGTPWCGKDGININMRVPLAGICFLRRGEENVIHRLSSQEALTQIIYQTIHRFREKKSLDLMLGVVEDLVQRIPIYEFYNKPELAAAQLSYETMRRGAEEEKL